MRNRAAIPELPELPHHDLVGVTPVRVLLRGFLKDATQQVQEMETNFLVSGRPRAVIPVCGRGATRVAREVESWR